MNRRPNFFIVGAPKCGTTALSAYLAEHPNVFMSSPKEPHHFAADFESVQGSYKSEKLYLDLFADVRKEHVAIGEASVWYLYSKRAIQAVKDFDPDAKIIIMLRNPTDLVTSLHSQQLFNQNEDVKDFEEAWALQESRLQGKARPKHLRHSPLFLQYADIGKMSEQVKRVYSIFPKDQVLILLFDEFASDTGAAYRSTLNFLGLDDDERVEFPRVNSNKKSRLAFITRFTRHTPPGLKLLLNKNRFVRNLKYKTIGLLDRLNQVPESREPQSADFQAHLSEFFQDDVSALESIIERDLSHWQ